MNTFLKNLFGNKHVGNIEITVFSIYHIIYIALIVGATLGAAFLLKNKSQKAKDITLKTLAYVAIGLYIADFFIMPLSQDSVDIDKLPFHICTLVSVFIPFAQFNKKFAPVRSVITTFAIVAPLMYITYPGSALGGISPLSYKVIQTFLFHGVVFAWGVLSLTTKATSISFKTIWKDAIGLLVMIIWAFFGNFAYSTTARSFDWFFVTGSTFPFIPTFLMPIAVFVAFFGMCAIINLINKLIVSHYTKKANK